MKAFGFFSFGHYAFGGQRGPSAEKNVTDGLNLMSSTLVAETTAEPLGENAGGSDQPLPRHMEGAGRAWMPRDQRPAPSSPSSPARTCRCSACRTPAPTR